MNLSFSWMLRRMSCVPFLLATTLAANAAMQDARLPPTVMNWLAQAKQDCPSGFSAKDAVEEADLTGDGRPGYIIDPHHLVCAGSPHLFVGDGPASIELFVTLPSGEIVHTGAVLALAYQLQQASKGVPPVIAFQTHEAAERAGSIDRYRWDGTNFALLNKNSMAAPPVDGPDREFEK